MRRALNGQTPTSAARTICSPSRRKRARRVRNCMADRAQQRPARTQARQPRALSLSATMREGSRSRAQVRVIDISTHGCRIECTTPVEDDSKIWLAIAGLENQYCRVVWHCQEFVGLEFEKPLAEAGARQAAQGPRAADRESDQGSAQHRHAHALAGAQGRRFGYHILAELSRQCAVDALVEGFRLRRRTSRR